MKEIAKNLTKTFIASIAMIAFVSLYLMFFMFMIHMQEKYHLSAPALIASMLAPLLIIGGGIYCYISRVIKPIAELLKDETEHQVNSKGDIK